MSDPELDEKWSRFAKALAVYPSVLPVKGEFVPVPDVVTEQMQFMEEQSRREEEIRRAIVALYGSNDKMTSEQEWATVAWTRLWELRRKLIGTYSVAHDRRTEGVDGNDWNSAMQVQSLHEAYRDELRRVFLNYPDSFVKICPRSFVEAVIHVETLVTCREAEALALSTDGAARQNFIDGLPDVPVPAALSPDFSNTVRVFLPSIDVLLRLQNRCLFPAIARYRRLITDEETREVLADMRDKLIHERGSP